MENDALLVTRFHLHCSAVILVSIRYHMVPMLTRDLIGHH